MTELLRTFFCSPGSTHTPSIQKRKKKKELAKGVSPEHMYVHTFLCIAEILMWKKAVGLLKDCVWQTFFFIEDRREGTLNSHQC